MPEKIEPALTFNSGLRPRFHSKTHRFNIILLMIYLIFPISLVDTAMARTFYVDPSGADSNDGLSTQAAWKTLERVSRAELSPGDTVLLKSGGTWREPLIVPTSGLKDSPIRFGRYGNGLKPLINCTREIGNFVAESELTTFEIPICMKERWTNQVFLNGERINQVEEELIHPLDYSIRNGQLKIFIKPGQVLPMLQISVAVFGSGILCKDRSDIIVEDIAVKGSRGTPGAISIIKSSRIAVRRCEISATRGFGIALASSEQVMIEDCEVHDCGLTGIGTSGDGSPSRYVQVRNNRIHRIGWLAMDRFNDGHGIGVGNLPGCSDWIIEGNDIFECGRGGGDKYTDGGCGPAITAWETHNIVIRRNRIYDNYRGGITLELGGMSSGDNHEVSFNLIYRNGRNPSGKKPSGTGWSGVGVYKFDGAFTVDDIAVVNNLVAENYLGFQGACSSGIYLTVAGNKKMTNVLVANNIVTENGATNWEFWRRSPNVEVKVLNSLFHRPGKIPIVKNNGQEFNAENFSDFIASVCRTCFTADPLFVDAEKGDFRLRNDSSCWKKGVFIPGFHDRIGVVDFAGLPIIESRPLSIGAYQ